LSDTRLFERLAGGISACEAPVEQRTTGRFGDARVRAALAFDSDVFSCERVFFGATCPRGEPNGAVERAQSLLRGPLTCPARGRRTVPSGVEGSLNSKKPPPAPSPKGPILSRALSKALFQRLHLDAVRQRALSTRPFDKGSTRLGAVPPRTVPPRTVPRGPSSRTVLDGPCEGPRRPTSPTGPYKGPCRAFVFVQTFQA